MAYKGPDISAWQGDIDITALSSQVDFFIFRSHAGISKDKKVDRNVNLAIQNDKPYGLYIYSYALNADRAKQEAQNVIDTANSYSVRPNFLVIDMEDADGYKKRNGMPSDSILRDICTTECEMFEQAGYYALIYASSSWFKNQLAGLDRFDKWVAHWPTSGGKQTGNNTSADGENSNNCGIWQFTSDGYLNGYSGKLDMNYGYKDFIVGGSNPQPVPQPTNPAEDTLTLVFKTMNGEFGDGDSRKANLGNRYNEVQDFINHIFGADLDTLVSETLAGKYGNGDTRRIVLGSRYDEVQNKINEQSAPTKKSNEEIAEEVKIGKWGNGEERKQRLTEAGYDYNTIQGIVNGSTSNQQSSSRYYTVKRGDTLSQIGAKLGVNWHTIANLNGIIPPYTIYVGQILEY